MQISISVGRSLCMSAVYTCLSHFFPRFPRFNCFFGGHGGWVANMKGGGGWFFGGGAAHHFVKCND